MAKRPANTAGQRPEFRIYDRDGARPAAADAESFDREADGDEGEDRAPDVSNSEIAVLLAQIGRRLHKSEQERQALRDAVKEYGESMETLESRGEQSEKIFLALQDRLSRQESAEESLRRRQDMLEQQARQTADRVEKAAALADRIEEAMAQQAKLARRLDTVAQDKARLVRKLERIEETMTETQNALQSRAMVLLTDHSRAVQAPASGATAGEAGRDASTWRSFLKGPGAAGLAGLVLLGMTFGLSIAAMEALNAPRGAAVSRAPAGTGDDARPPVPSLVQTPAPSAAPAPARPRPSATDDVLGLSGSELNDRFDRDPDALAAALNAIEPSTLPPDAAAGEAEVPSPVLRAPASTREPPPLPDDVKAEAEKTAPSAKASSPETGAIFDSGAFLKSQAPQSPLSARMQHDPALSGRVAALEKEAFAGVPEAQHDLAAIYTSGRDGVAADYGKAAAWFREAAVNGVANAQYNLGVLYHQGMGVPQNTSMALDWYRAAAAHGHPEAQYNLGIAYIEGVGTPYDPAAAAASFRSAAVQGVMEASYNLGLIYENGLLGAPRPEMALYWYRTAGNQGSPEGRAAMNQLARGMNLTPAAMDRMYDNVEAAEKAAGRAVPARDIPMRAMAAQPRPAAEPRTAGGAAETKASAPGKPAAGNAANGTAAPDPNAAIVAQVQDRLRALGLYRGPSDGVAGDSTAEAIRAYQRQNGFPQDGRASQALLVNLMSAGLGRAKPAQAPAARAMETQSLRPGDLGDPG